MNPRPPAHQRREHDFKPGHVDRMDLRVASQIAERVTYGGHGKHKDYPAPDHEWEPVHRIGTARCGRFSKSDWPQLQTLLREAICRSCVQLEAQSEFPVRVWAYINDRLHEARVTNRGIGLYHGFPLDFESQKPLDPHDLLRNAPRATIAID